MLLKLGVIIQSQGCELMSEQLITARSNKILGHHRVLQRWVNPSKPPHLSPGISHGA